MSCKYNMNENLFKPQRQKNVKKKIKKKKKTPTNNQNKTYPLIL